MTACVVLVFGRRQQGGSARSTDRRPKTNTEADIERLKLGRPRATGKFRSAAAAGLSLMPEAG
jgi:hypothetical protein